jgi:hypothetical protein
MRLPFRRWHLIVPAVFVLAVAAVLFLPTRRERFTKENFDRIQVRMTQQEVLDLLGRSPTRKGWRNLFTEDRTWERLEVWSWDFNISPDGIYTTAAPWADQVVVTIDSSGRVVRKSADSRPREP